MVVVVGGNMVSGDGDGKCSSQENFLAFPSTKFFTISFICAM